MGLLRLFRKGPKESSTVEKKNKTTETMPKDLPPIPDTPVAFERTFQNLLVLRDEMRWWWWCCTTPPHQVCVLDWGSKLPPRPPLLATATKKREVRLQFFSSRSSIFCWSQPTSVPIIKLSSRLTREHCLWAKVQRPS